MDVSNSLGIKKMPEGYTLMLNNDQTHYHWSKDDRVESDIHWDKWAIWRGAVEHSKQK
jgi:hypothetical protein